MAWIRKSDGTRVAVADEEVWGPPLTEEQQEEEDRKRLPTVKRFQLAGVAEHQGAITWTEAQAWAGGTSLPTVITDTIANSTYPADVKKKAVLVLLGNNDIAARTIEFNLIRTSFGLTKRQAISFFRLAKEYNLGDS